MAVLTSNGGLDIFESRTNSTEHASWQRAADLKSRVEGYFARLDRSNSTNGASSRRQFEGLRCSIKTFAWSQACVFETAHSRLFGDWGVVWIALANEVNEIILARACYLSHSNEPLTDSTWLSEIEGHFSVHDTEQGGITPPGMAAERLSQFSEKIAWSPWWMDTDDGNRAFSMLAFACHGLVKLKRVTMTVRRPKTRESERGQRPKIEVGSQEWTVGKALSKRHPIQALKWFHEVRVTSYTEFHRDYLAACVLLQFC